MLAGPFFLPVICHIYLYMFAHFQELQSSVSHKKSSNNGEDLLPDIVLSVV